MLEDKIYDIDNEIHSCCVTLTIRSDEETCSLALTSENRCSAISVFVETKLRLYTVRFYCDIVDKTRVV